MYLQFILHKNIMPLKISQLLSFICPPVSGQRSLTKVIFPGHGLIWIFPDPQFFLTTLSEARHGCDIYCDGQQDCQGGHLDICCS